MLWKLLLALSSFFIPQGSDRHADSMSFEMTSVGPQSFRDLVHARDALHGEHHGGDMLFSHEFTSGAGIKDTKFRWPKYPGGGEVPYVIDSSVASMKSLILKAIDQYHKLTCIRFVERTNEKDYIRLFAGRGCYSYVGKVGGKQDVSLGKGCGYVGTIVHELGHAIGLYHEHQRSDRNTYLNVYENNVISGQGHNFEKTDPSKELILTSYDYSSIMHYGNYAFSKQPGKLVTMEAKNGEKLLEPYSKSGFTDTDVDMIKKLYKC